MNHLRGLIGIAVVTTTLVAGGTARAALADTATPRTSTSARVCYETENQFGEWKPQDQGCDGQIVSPSGGVHGLAITVDGDRQVLYSASSDGKVYEDGTNGNEVNTHKQTLKLRAELAPRTNRHLEYTVSYDDPVVGVESDRTASDNQWVGDGTHVINRVSFRITTW
jgi:hypothetical protein